MSKNYKTCPYHNSVKVLTLSVLQTLLWEWANDNKHKKTYHNERLSKPHRRRATGGSRTRTGNFRDRAAASGAGAVRLCGQGACLSHAAEHFLSPSGDYPVSRHQAGSDGRSEARGRLGASPPLASIQVLAD
jgi:hypothetical protein